MAKIFHQKVSCFYEICSICCNFAAITSILSIKSMQDIINNRCGWCGTDELYVRYHDEEWGKLATDDKTLFEFLILESAQAGLSWITVLRNHPRSLADVLVTSPEAEAMSKDMRDGDLNSLVPPSATHICKLWDTSTTILRDAFFRCQVMRL